MKTDTHTPDGRLGRLAAAAMLVAALNASAQSTVPNASPSPDVVELEAFQIVGYRASLAKSLETKRESTAIIDVITAEDVGKFPDINVAESLSHLTGISVDRQFGEGEKVSILGTDPALNRVLINGQAIASGDWGGNPTDTSGRTFNYTLLSPEIIGTAEVYKATEARIDDGSIGGTVIIRTHRPLDLPANTFRASAGYSYNDRSEQGNWRGSVLYSWKNDARTLGALVALTHDKEDLWRGGIEYWGFTTYKPDENGPTYTAPFGMNTAWFKQKRERDGIQAALQWKVNDRLELNVTGVHIEGIYDNFSQSRYVVPIYWGIVDGYTANSDNLITSGHVKAGNATLPDGTVLVGSAANPYNANGQYDTNLRKSKVETDSIHLHGDYRTPEWHLGFDVGHTRARGGKDPEYLFSMMFNQDYSWGYNGQSSHLTFDDPAAATNPAAYSTRRAIPSQYIVNGNYVNIDNADNGRYQAGGIEYTTTKDMEDYAQLDFDRPVSWGPINTILVGAKYTDHINRQDSRGNFIPVTSLMTLANFSPSAAPNLWSGIDAGGDQIRMVVPSQDAVVDYLLGQPQGVMEEKRGQEWYVNEKNAAAYAQANMSGERWRGNFGVRVVNTTDVAKYWEYNDNTRSYSKVRKETDYTKVLPSFNFAYDITKDLVVRAGLAQVVARPRYSDLAGQFSLDNTRLTGSGGNPDLKPYESDNVNLSLEWYPTSSSLFSAELFLRKIDNYVLNVTQDRVLFNTATGQNATYSVSSPFNAGDAEVSGIAITAQQDLFWGFGIQANATFSDSDTTVGYNLPYLSKTTYNIIPYFEKGPFAARVSYSWRSEFFTSIGRLNIPLFADSYEQLDASASYQITKNLAVTVNAANLLDSTYFWYYQYKYAPMGVYKNGRKLALSVSYKF